MLDRLERKYGRFAVPNLTLILIGLQVFFYLGAAVTQGQEQTIRDMAMVPERVLEGQWWRMITFAIMPIRESPLFFVIFLYIFWLKGSALEHEWGAFRYNLYLLIGYVATLAASWVGMLQAPEAPTTNLFLYLSVVLAFSALYPNFQLLLFFILPIKAKWIGIVIAILYGGFLINALAMRDLQTAAVILAAVLNFFLFFGPGFVHRMRQKQRRMRIDAEKQELAEQPFHRCVVCGRTEQSDPQLEFRYCPHCTGAPCYCMDHIFEHEHQ